MLPVNVLAQLIASGRISEEELAQLDAGQGQNVLAQMAQQRPPADRLVADQEYSVSGSPVPTRNGDFKVYPGEGMPAYRNIEINPQQPQAQAQPQSMMKVVGFGNGQARDLAPEPAGPVAIDYARPQIDIPGVGKGYYGKDGRSAYVANADGTKTKVILGYDAEGSARLNKADLDRRQGEQQIAASQASTAHMQEQTAASVQARNTREGMPGYGVPQSTLEKQFGKAPEGKRWTMNGQLEDVPGGSGKPLTESQGKAAGLATRAQAAHDILAGFEAKGVTTPSLIKQGAEAVPLVGGALGMAVNKIGIPSSDQQRVEQAQRDFVNAALRVESGASISQSEFDNARKQYFPQPGDSPEAILQKQQAREREIASLGIQSGRGASNIDKAKASGERDRVIADAKQAIAKGAPRDKVRQRLQAAGISDAGI